MSDPRPLFRDNHLWPSTIPGVLPAGVAASTIGPAKRGQAPALPPTTDTHSRSQPPLQEVLKGLDARELEGQSVFDQLFGPLPDGDPRLPRA